MPNSSSLVFQQKDTFNCGVCCLLFVYDLLVSQAFTSWQQKITEADTLPNEIRLGASVFNPDVGHQEDTKTFVKKLYRFFRFEMILLIERLRYLFLESKFSNTKIEKNANWGKGSEAYKALKDELTLHFSSSLVLNKKLIKCYDTQLHDIGIINTFSKNYTISAPTSLFVTGDSSSVLDRLGLYFTTKTDFDDKVTTIYIHL